MAKIIEKLRLGYCSGCDKKILDFTKKDPKERKLPEYREHIFELNDDSLMKVAVCDICDKEMDSKLADNIMKRHYKTWQTEIKASEIIPEDKKEDSIKHHLALKAVKFGIVKNLHIKGKKEKEKSKDDKDRELKEKQEQENIKMVEVGKKKEAERLAKIEAEEAANKKAVAEMKRKEKIEAEAEKRRNAEDLQKRKKERAVYEKIIAEQEETIKKMEKNELIINAKINALG